MASLFADEEFDFPIVELLLQLKHDVLNCRDAGLAGKAITDEMILATAVHLQRAVITFDRRDYVRLHRASADHFGIVVCRRDLNHTALVARIDAALQREGDLRGKLIRVNKLK